MAERPPLDAALAARLVAAQFPQWAHLPIDPVPLGGVNNRTFRLGDDMLVRMPSARRYAEQAAKEQAWLPRLAPKLPLPIPTPVAFGEPGEGYPGRWSVYRWIPGETAREAWPADDAGFARDLAGFLAALQDAPTAGAPEPGPHNFLRGASPSVYDEQTRKALDALGDAVDRRRAEALWESAVATAWDRPPVWIHGDVAPGNLLLREGRLSAVIDWGICGVGDPACDLAIAWTHFSGDARAAFRAGLPLDEATWLRGRAWALWKALILMAGLSGDHPDASRAPHVVAQALDDAVTRAWPSA